MESSDGESDSKNVLTIAYVSWCNNCCSFYNGEVTLHLMGCNSINIVPARQFDPLLQISSTKDLHLDPAILDSDFQQPASDFAHEC